MANKRSAATRRSHAEAAAARAAEVRAEQARKERRRRTLTVSAVVAAVLAIVLVLGYFLQSNRDTSGASGQAPAGAVATYAVPAGPSSAPVKVDVYEDFMCPFCGQFEAATRPSLEKQVQAGKVQLRYHVLNFLDGSSTTAYSTRAANALAVVLDTAGPKVAKTFHDLLFEHQPQEGSAGLSDAQLVDYAVQAGADRAEVTQGVQSRRFEQWVKNVTDQSSKDGVTGTPTVKVNGTTLQYQTIPQLVGELDKAITQAGG